MQQNNMYSFWMYVIDASFFSSKWTIRRDILTWQLRLQNEITY